MIMLDKMIEDWLKERGPTRRILGYLNRRCLMK